MRSKQAEGSTSARAPGRRGNPWSAGSAVEGRGPTWRRCAGAGAGGPVEWPLQQLPSSLHEPPHRQPPHRVVVRAERVARQRLVVRELRRGEPWGACGGRGAEGSGRRGRRWREGCAAVASAERRQPLAPQGDDAPVARRSRPNASARSSRAGLAGRRGLPTPSLLDSGCRRPRRGRDLSPPRPGVPVICFRRSLPAPRREAAAVGETGRDNLLSPGSRHLGFARQRRAEGPLCCAPPARPPARPPLPFLRPDRLAEPGARFWCRGGRTRGARTWARAPRRRWSAPDACDRALLDLVCKAPWGAWARPFAAGFLGPVGGVGGGVEGSPTGGALTGPSKAKDRGCARSFGLGGG